MCCTSLNSTGEAMKEQPAFPTYFTYEHAMSMTLRDYFAAQAVSAILDQYDFTFFAEDEGKQVGDTFAFSVAKNAYSMADAMMEARK
jgi:hypothetical protein